MTDRTRPALRLAADAFRVQETLIFEGRPVGLLITGQWTDDGGCELFAGVTALEPLDHCRVILAASFDPDRGLDLARVSENDDPRDDPDVLKRHFGKSVRGIVGIVAATIGRALVEAAEIREAAAADRPVRETAALAWMH